MLLGHQEETERSHVVFPSLYGENFFQKNFSQGGPFWTNLCEENLKVVHWCVDGDVGN